VGSPKLAKVLEAWDLSAALQKHEPPASPDDIEQAQRLIGRRLPSSAVELYRAVGGGSFVGGNLMLAPLLPPPGDDEGWALTTLSDLLRSWDWPVPNEMVIFGDNGGEESFGLWLPANGDGARPLVVEIGEVFEDACLTVVGDDLPSFLLGWTAFYLLSAQDRFETREAVGALGLPHDLRSLEGGGTDEELSTLLRWASPGLPDPRPDAYRRGLTAAQVDKVAQAPIVDRL